MDEYDFMRLAIDEAKKSEPEDEREHPKVGVVLVKNGELLGSAYRGELGPGDHAEFTLLEKKLGDATLAGATAYVTLEPCTTRKHPKICCAERLIEHKVARVVIGMLDPNPLIHSQGYELLRKAGIVVEFFTPELTNEIEELNRRFKRYQEQRHTRELADQDFVQKFRNRNLDDWHNKLKFIYNNANHHRDMMSLFTHLVEVVGGLSLLASHKNKAGISGEEFVPKSVAWWMALCSKAEVDSVSELLWTKFPYVCAYCLECPHVQDICSERKAASPGPNWDKLKEIGQKNSHLRPSTLGDWQKMFAAIYPVQQIEGYELPFARLTEELGELAEAVRVWPKAKGYFRSEAADVFAWIMHIQNLVEFKAEIPRAERGDILKNAFCGMYPDRCKNCDNHQCSCPPILPSTIGRISHEFPR